MSVSTEKYEQLFIHQYICKCLLKLNINFSNTFALCNSFAIKHEKPTVDNKINVLVQQFLTRCRGQMLPYLTEETIYIHTDQLSTSYV
jgi:hypothetical protein